jgi:hypothetical protein
MIHELELPVEALTAEIAEREALPVCLSPWRENPYRLVSLWTMLQLHAGTFVSHSASLMKFWLGLRHGATLDEHGLIELGSALGELKRECEKHGFHSSLNQINRIDLYIKSRRFVPSEPLGELVLRIQEDLEAELFLAVPKGRVQYYEPKDPLFGQAVADNFPSTAYDIIEAGKCHALHRSTACVFHLMRVLESGLTVFADKFGVPSDHTNWHNIIEGIEKAVRNMGSDPARSADWKNQQEFYSQAASHLMTFKDAWRNYTAHARGKFTEDEVEIILPNVRAFMQKLATRLHE